jgi:DNA-binding NtrC family response regulator
MTEPVTSAPSRPEEAADKRALRILVVDDDRTLREGCANILRIDDHHVTVFSRGEEAIEAARRQHFDVALVDLYMTPVSGMDVLRAIVAADPQTLVVVMTGNPTVASSLDALRAGAWDYLPKPFSASHLQVLVGRAAHAVRTGARTDRGSLAPARGGAGGSAPSGDDAAGPGGAPAGGGAAPGATSDDAALIGESPSFRQAVTMAKRVATTDASVMICGESGTGKEVIAQLIHRHSRRSSRKLVAVNCAALPGPLLESEMFGHKKGAFTGADRDKPGLLEMANGGTLFLDELGEMPMTLQAKLLRVLQDGVVRRVGSEKQDAVVDVRFVAATNRDPHEASAGAAARGPVLPPVRGADQASGPAPAARTTSRCSRPLPGAQLGRAPQPGTPLPAFTEESLAFLQSRAWRGNVRELQNVIEHLSVLVEPGRPIHPADIPLYEEEAQGGEEGRVGLPPGIFGQPFHSAKEQLVAHFEREYLARLAARAGGNMSKAARLAGIDRTTLYRLMEKHAMRREEARAPDDDPVRFLSGPGRRPPTARPGVPDHTLRSPDLRLLPPTRHAGQTHAAAAPRRGRRGCSPAQHPLFAAAPVALRAGWAGRRVGGARRRGHLDLGARWARHPRARDGCDARGAAPYPAGALRGTPGRRAGWPADLPGGPSGPGSGRPSWCVPSARGCSSRRSPPPTRQPVPPRAARWRERAPTRRRCSWCSVRWSASRRRRAATARERSPTPSVASTPSSCSWRSRTTCAPPSARSSSSPSGSRTSSAVSWARPRRGSWG